MLRPKAGIFSIGVILGGICLCLRLDNERLLAVIIWMKTKPFCDLQLKFVLGYYHNMWDGVCH